MPLVAALGRSGARSLVFVHFSLAADEAFGPGGMTPK